MPDAIVTHHYRLTAGPHAGQLITRVPVEYLHELAHGGGPEAPLARAELERRGTRASFVEVTHHAIDRASQALLRLWKKSRRPEEGLYSWLARMAEEAIRRHKPRRDGAVKLRYAGIEFAFEWSETRRPIVKTVVKCAPEPRRTKPLRDDDESE